MKQGIIVIALILILLTAAFFENNFIKTTFSEFEQKVVSFEDSLLLDEENINKEENKQSIEELISFWENKEKTLFLFLSHQHLQEIIDELYTIKVSIDFNDTKEAILSTQLILSFIKDYSDFAVVSWQSIF
jgi:hypothetical protein